MKRFQNRDGLVILLAGHQLPHFQQRVSLNLLYALRIQLLAQRLLVRKQAFVAGHLVQRLLKNAQRFERRAGKQFFGLRDRVIHQTPGFKLASLGVYLGLEAMQHRLIRQLFDGAIKQLRRLVE